MAARSKKSEPPLRLPEADAGRLVAYTDGSGTQAHLPCGCGVVLCDDRVVVAELSLSLGLGSNNHAELSGVRAALALAFMHAAGSGRRLVVRTDSMYAVGALTADAEPFPGAANAALIALVRSRLRAYPAPVSFEHVAGHSGEPGNERADALAGAARLRQLAGLETPIPDPLDF